ncbi:MAG: hypothetical protein QOE05_1698 [Actinomycetota bacterium]|nr:hypothetical protein [Actinomycetota bacterium]
MTTAPDVVPSIIKTVTVPLDQRRAFELFTTGIGQWWPLDGHSVGGAASAVALSPTAIVETLSDGTTTTWGEVLEWEPPARVVLTWHPGEDGGPEQTRVAVTFEAVSEGTLIRLEHSGWERVQPARRVGYDTGWDVVLGAFVAAA